MIKGHVLGPSDHLGVIADVRFGVKWKWVRQNYLIYYLANIILIKYI